MKGVGSAILWIVGFVGVLALQVFLCQRKRRAMGLILPALFLVCSLAVTVGMTAGRLAPERQRVWVVVAEDGRTYRCDSPEAAQARADALEAQGLEVTRSTAGPTPRWYQVALLFLACNLPTAACLLIYGAGRRLRRAAERRAMDRMRIDDLE